MTKQKAVIYDVDGTLADVRTIAHYFTGNYGQYGTVSDEDVDSYHREAVDVPPVKWVANSVHHDIKLGHTIIVVTSRKMKYAELTAEFMCKNDIHVDMMFFRADDEACSDYDLKKNILVRIRALGYEIVRAFEDNPTIIELWESEGVPVVIPVEGYGFYG